MRGDMSKAQKAKARVEDRARLATVTQMASDKAAAASLRAMAASERAKRASRAVDYARKKRPGTLEKLLDRERYLIRAATAAYFDAAGAFDDAAEAWDEKEKIDEQLQALRKGK